MYVCIHMYMLLCIYCKCEYRMYTHFYIRIRIRFIAVVFLLLFLYYCAFIANVRMYTDTYVYLLQWHISGVLNGHLLYPRDRLANGRRGPFLSPRVRRANRREGLLLPLGHGPQRSVLCFQNLLQVEIVRLAVIGRLLGWEGARHGRSDTENSQTEDNTFYLVTVNTL